MCEFCNKYEIITTEHGTFKTNRVTETYKRRKKWEPVNPKLVQSFIPGTIIEVNVKVGDKVKVGDSLITLNVMKMNTKIVSDIEATVKSVNVTQGDKIPKGFLMIEFE